MTLQEFMAVNRIEPAVWEASCCDWSMLEEILSDYRQQQRVLTECATSSARLIQEMPRVHSVRWRIKDEQHLLEKIVRKRADGEPKYQNLNAANYFEIVTDLVGIRAIHLFKENYAEIHDALRNTWIPTESPVAYIRDGDPEQLQDDYKRNDLTVKVHPAGYRSVHYVFQSTPTIRPIKFEVQVRTIFEEGWSEIDHKVRYPNFSNNELIAYFLAIFNRLAGSSDEMGSFVQNLAQSIDSYEARLLAASEAKRESLEKMDDLIEQLGRLKERDAKSTATITQLKAQVSKMRNEQLASALLPMPKMTFDMSSKDLKEVYVSKLSELAQLGIVKTRKPGKDD